MSIWNVSSIPLGTPQTQAGKTAEKPDRTPAIASEGADSVNEPVFRFAAVRYQVKDIDRSVQFYTQRLGFHLEQQFGTAFAKVSHGSFILWLSGPASSGSRPMPDGRTQEPGGWNRFALQVDDLDSRVASMKKTGLHFRNDIETGPGGKQIQLDDPDGNPIELFEPMS